MTCNCYIIPDDVLERFAADPELSDEIRQNFHHSAEISRRVRAVREQNAALTLTAISLQSIPPIPVPAPHQLPPGQVFNCHTTMTLRNGRAQSGQFG